MNNTFTTSVHPSKIIKDLEYNYLKNVNVVLINTPIREAAAPTVLPEGPLLLATNLRDNFGVNASLIDLNGYRIHDKISKQKGLSNGRQLNKKETYNLLEKHFEKHGIPEMVGLSGIITTLDKQQGLAKMIRDLAPETHLVSGGGLATELGVGLFNYIPELDDIAKGEGDEVIVKIAYDAKIIQLFGLKKALLGNKLNPYSVGEIGKKHRFVYEGASPHNLNALPFADLELLKEDVNGFSILDYYLGNAVWGKVANNSSATPFTMEKSTTFVSSRGCPHACDFCYKGAQGGRDYKFRSAENVASQIKLHKEKYGVDFVGMVDDNFGISRNRIRELLPLLKPLNIRWGTHMRLDEAADIKNISKNRTMIFEDEKRVDMMAEAGCIYIGFGGESASPRVLKSMNKGGFILRNGMEEVIFDKKKYEFPRSMVQGIKNSLGAGIHPNCTWIMGYPKETLLDLQTSIAFIKWQEECSIKYGEADSVNREMFTATAYPGTPMFSRLGVMKKLSDNFKIKFDFKQKPICDENFRQYILGLEDATKILVDTKGNPLNYSDMDDKTFLKARNHINEGNLEKVLGM